MQLAISQQSIINQTIYNQLLTLINQSIKSIYSNCQYYIVRNTSNYKVKTQRCNDTDIIAEI